MSKFSIGDSIEPIDKGRGFDYAVVIGKFVSDEKKFKGKEMYLLKIMNGTAVVPVSAEECYRLSKRK